MLMMCLMCQDEQGWDGQAVVGVGVAVGGHGALCAGHAPLHPHLRHRHPEHQAQARAGERGGRPRLHLPRHQHHRLRSHWLRHSVGFTLQLSTNSSVSQCPEKAFCWLRALCYAK